MIERELLKLFKLLIFFDRHCFDDFSREVIDFYQK